MIPWALEEETRNHIYVIIVLNGFKEEHIRDLNKVECPQGVHCFVYLCLERTGACAANGAINGGHGQWNGVASCLLMNRTSACNITMVGFEFGDSVHMTATAGSDVVQSGHPIFDDFFQHLWPYIGNNTANVVFQMVKRLWLIRIDQ
ncbi:hypothetical protein TNCV_3445631 [Trichonephila clavipes]|nr:hypothetical protein TNCV_3445631 [Trichonephila clavipes]